MKNNQFHIIVKSLLDNALSNIDLFNDDELRFICEILDYKNVPDRYFVDNPRIHPFIRWEKLDKMQAVRIVIRNLDLIEKINLKKYNYRIKEIFFLIHKKPELLFTHFNFSFDNLSHDDAFFLLCIGNEKYWDLIDIDKYRFNFIETLHIIRAYNFKRSIIQILDYKSLKSYQVAEILINTGEEMLDLFDIDSLTTLDWLNILPYQPDLLYYCNYEKFIQGDPYNLIQLVVLFDSPDLSYLLDSVDTNDITPLGWEKLLISRPDKFVDKCRFYKLNENNWSVISCYRPELLVYKL